MDPKPGLDEEFGVDGDQNHGSDQDNSEESRHWNEARQENVLLKPKYGVDGEAFENVWGSGEPSTPPRENP